MFNNIIFLMLCLYFYFYLLINICICLEVIYVLMKFFGWYFVIFVYELFSFLDKGIEIVFMVGFR